MSSGAPLPSSFDSDADFYEESRWQKFKRRLIEEPLIPLGCGLTCAALYGATSSIRAGDSNRANIMFRRRIYAQGFTLLALVVGSVYWQKDRDKRKEFEGLVSEKKRQEKRDAWIRELEVRDTEDREVKARMDKRLDRIRDRESRTTSSTAGLGSEISTEEQNKGILEKTEEQARKAFGKGGDSKSMLEASESRGVLAAVRDLGWGR